MKPFFLIPQYYLQNPALMALVDTGEDIMQGHDFARLHGGPCTVVVDAGLRSLNRATRKHRPTEQKGSRQVLNTPIKGHCHSLGLNA